MTNKPLGKANEQGQMFFPIVSNFQVGIVKMENVGVCVDFLQRQDHEPQDIPQFSQFVLDPTTARQIAQALLEAANVAEASAQTTSQ